MMPERSQAGVDGRAVVSCGDGDRRPGHGDGRHGRRPVDRAGRRGAAAHRPGDSCWSGPELDLEWEHHPSHFWLVLLTAAVNVALAYVTNVAAGPLSRRAAGPDLARLPRRRRVPRAPRAGDARRARREAERRVLDRDADRARSSRRSSRPPSTSRSRARGRRSSFALRPVILAGLLALMAVWGVLSIAGLPPLDGPPPATRGVGLLAVLGVVAVGLYAFAAWRTYSASTGSAAGRPAHHRRRHGPAGRGMVAVVVSRNWRLSWWEWHVLMLAAFVAIALGAREEYRRSGSLTGAFGGLYLEATLARIDRWHAGAIAAVAAAEAERRVRSTRCSTSSAARAPRATRSPCWRSGRRAAPARRVVPAVPAVGRSPSGSAERDAAAAALAGEERR